MKDPKPCVLNTTVLQDDIKTLRSLPNSDVLKVLASIERIDKETVCCLLNTDVWIEITC